MNVSEKCYSELNVKDSRLPGLNCGLFVFKCSFLVLQVKSPELTKLINVLFIVFFLYLNNKRRLKDNTLKCNMIKHFKISTRLILLFYLSPFHQMTKYWYWSNIFVAWIRKYVESDRMPFQQRSDQGILFKSLPNEEGRNKTRQRVQFEENNATCSGMSPCQSWLFWCNNAPRVFFPLIPS